MFRMNTRSYRHAEEEEDPIQRQLSACSEEGESDASACMRRHQASAWAPECSF